VSVSDDFAGGSTTAVVFGESLGTIFVWVGFCVLHEVVFGVVGTVVVGVEEIEDQADQPPPPPLVGTFTVNERVTGVASVFPCASVARIRAVWAPWERLL
jgi:hypothetical protein